MERALMKELRRWKASPRRKPLVLKGARQVGKTWLMKELGRQCYAKTAYVNFDRNPRMKQVFDQDLDIERILMAIPLRAYLEENAYKLFFLDIGLLGAISELDARSLLEGNRVFIEFKGALTEQYVCQQLLSDSSCEPYYYTSESGRYEIDFMIQQSGSVVPVEVKAERNVHAKSLRAYYDKYHPEETIRLSMNDYRQEEWVENIPLFAMHAFF